MNIETGEIHEQLPNETLDEMANRLGILSNKLVSLGKLPDEKCPKCGGKGYKKRGLNSKRFKPCECTK